MNKVKNGKYKVLMISSEAAPYAKSGGLGDVCGSLPKELQKLGVDVRVVIPKYKTIKQELIHKLEFVEEFQVNLSWREETAKIFCNNEEKVPTYFIENDRYFSRDNLYGYDDDHERFGFFCKAALDMLAKLDFYPDVIHCNDWQTGPLSMFLKGPYRKMIFYAPIKTLFTVHNLQYQGNFGNETMDLLEIPQDHYDNVEFYNKISFMKMGLVYADKINTVSTTYAEEIQTPQYGYGMDGVLRSRKSQLFGILNGIDYHMYNPATDPQIEFPFDENTISMKKKNKSALQKQLGLPQKEVPMISMVTRLADQKGLDIVSESLEELLAQDIQFVVLGTGENRYEMMFRELEKRFPEKVSANLLFDDTLAQRIYASSDIFLMPSLFEPCGLGQLFSLRYGTIPVVRKTGGLADTITHYDSKTKKGNGFVFENYDKFGLLWGIKEALRIYHMGTKEWSYIIRNAMKCNYSWENSAKKYLELYEKLCLED